MSELKDEKQEQHFISFDIDLKNTNPKLIPYLHTAEIVLNAFTSTSEVLINPGLATQDNPESKGIAQEIKNLGFSPEDMGFRIENLDIGKSIILVDENKKKVERDLSRAVDGHVSIKINGISADIFLLQAIKKTIKQSRDSGTLHKDLFSLFSHPVKEFLSQYCSQHGFTQSFALDFQNHGNCCNVSMHFDEIALEFNSNPDGSVSAIITQCIDSLMFSTTDIRIPKQEGSKFFAVINSEFRITPNVKGGVSFLATRLHIEAQPIVFTILPQIFNLYKASLSELSILEAEKLKLDCFNSFGPLISLMARDNSPDEVVPRCIDFNAVISQVIEQERNIGGHIQLIEKLIGIVLPLLLMFDDFAKNYIEFYKTIQNLNASGFLKVKLLELNEFISKNQSDRSINKLLLISNFFINIINSILNIYEILDRLKSEENINKAHDLFALFHVINYIKIVFELNAELFNFLKLSEDERVSKIINNMQVYLIPMQEHMQIESQPEKKQVASLLGQQQVLLTIPSDPDEKMLEFKKNFSCIKKQFLNMISFENDPKVLLAVWEKLSCIEYNSKNVNESVNSYLIERYQKYPFIKKLIGLDADKICSVIDSYVSSIVPLNIDTIDSQYILFTVFVILRDLYAQEKLQQHSDEKKSQENIQQPFSMIKAVLKNQKAEYSVDELQITLSSILCIEEHIEYLITQVDINKYNILKQFYIRCICEHVKILFLLGYCRQKIDLDDEQKSNEFKKIKEGILKALELLYPVIKSNEDKNIVLKIIFDLLDNYHEELNSFFVIIAEDDLQETSVPMPESKCVDLHHRKSSGALSLLEVKDERSASTSEIKEAVSHHCKPADASSFSLEIKHQKLVRKSIKISEELLNAIKIKLSIALYAKKNADIEQQDVLNQEIINEKLKLQRLYVFISNLLLRESPIIAVFMYQYCTETIPMSEDHCDEISQAWVLVAINGLKNFPSVHDFANLLRHFCDNYLGNHKFLRVFTNLILTGNVKNIDFINENQDYKSVIQKLEELKLSFEKIRTQLKCKFSGLIPVYEQINHKDIENVSNNIDNLSKIIIEYKRCISENLLKEKIETFGHLLKTFEGRNQKTLSSILCLIGDIANNSPKDFYEIIQKIPQEMMIPFVKECIGLWSEYLKNIESAKEIDEIDESNNAILIAKFYSKSCLACLDWLLIVRHILRNVLLKCKAKSISLSDQDKIFVKELFMDACLFDHGNEGLGEYFKALRSNVLEENVETGITYLINSIMIAAGSVDREIKPENQFDFNKHLKNLESFLFRCDHERIEEIKNLLKEISKLYFDTGKKLAQVINPFDCIVSALSRLAEDPNNVKYRFDAACAYRKTFGECPQTIELLKPIKPYSGMQSLINVVISKVEFFDDACVLLSSVFEQFANEIQQKNPAEKYKMKKLYISQEDIILIEQISPGIVHVQQECNLLVKEICSFLTEGFSNYHKLIESDEAEKSNKRQLLLKKIATNIISSPLFGGTFSAQRKSSVSEFLLVNGSSSPIDSLNTPPGSRPLSRRGSFAGDLPAAAAPSVDALTAAIGAALLQQSPGSTPTGSKSGSGFDNVSFLTTQQALDCGKLSIDMNAIRTVQQKKPSHARGLSTVMSCVTPPIDGDGDCGFGRPKPVVVIKFPVVQEKKQDSPASSPFGSPSGCSGDLISRPGSFSGHSDYDPPSVGSLFGSRSQLFSPPPPPPPPVIISVSVAVQSFASPPSA